MRTPIGDLAFAVLVWGACRETIPCTSPGTDSRGSETSVRDSDE